MLIFSLKITVPRAFLLTKSRNFARYSLDPDLASMYLDWMTNVRVGAMMETSNNQISLLVNTISSNLDIAIVSAATANAMGEYTTLQTALQNLIDTYGQTPCPASLPLSWQLSNSAQKRQNACELSPSGTTTTGTITAAPTSTPLCYPAADPDSTISEYCYCNGYPFTLPILSNSNNVCGYATLPDPYPFTWTDPYGDIIACQSSMTAVLAGYPVTACVGSSLTAYTAPDAPTYPPNPYPYTMTDPFGDIMACQSLNTADLAGYPVTACAGSSSTVYTAPDAPTSTMCLAS